MVHPATKRAVLTAITALAAKLASNVATACGPTVILPLQRS
ncbi:hypothetical protein V1282_005628 [Nitrobacteraceae bacterium AZCC 2146]